MNRFLAVCLWLALLLVLPIAATAKTEHKYDNGPCPEGGAFAEWYSLTTFEDGRPVWVQGRGCDGNFYSHEICNVRIVGSDPIVSTNHVHMGTCVVGGTGGAGGAWRGQVVYNSSYQFAGIRGLDCTGQYYVVEDVELTFPGNEPQGGLN